ncbi:MAG: endonuclease III [Clostridia bacterium]|nr:endonuclease III [Clostridia bacterium]
MNDNKKRAAEAVERLKKIYPDATCALEWGGADAWKLLVMGRLSAQCTDARVNIVCRELFYEFPTLDALADAPLERIEEIVRPCGLYRVKAADIKSSCRMLIDDFGGIVPDSMDELLRLPGVGRKIANLLLGDIYKMPAVVADTHCIRICGRLGFYPEELKDPVKVERIMSECLVPEEQSDFCHRIVQFGRDVCIARSPKCAECPLGDICEGKRV